MAHLKNVLQNWACPVCLPCVMSSCYGSSVPLKRFKGPAQEKLHSVFPLLI